MQSQKTNTGESLKEMKIIKQGGPRDLFPRLTEIGILPTTAVRVALRQCCARAC